MMRTSKTGIHSYGEFLLESVIRASKDFRRILNLMQDDSKVAASLLDLLDRDVKTNYNFIKISDDPSKLSFVPDAQATRRMAGGASEDELFAAASNPTTIGRLVRSIFTQNGVPISDAGLETFSNTFRSYANMLSKSGQIRIVKGEEIRKWYDGKTYAGRDGRDGTLNKSCMRHEECQEFFDLYVENPDVVSMVIKCDDSGKLEARALVWETDKGTYLDRVYYTRDEYEKLVQIWAEKNLDEPMMYGKSGSKRLSVKLRPHAAYRGYPYMDTFCYYKRQCGKEESCEGTLFNYEIDIDSRWIYKLQDTEGGAESMNTVYSEYHDDQIPRDRAVYSDQVNSWIHEDHSVYSVYLNDNLPQDVAVHSRTVGSWLYLPDAVQVVVTADGRTDYYPEDDHEYPYVTEKLTGRHYRKKIAEELLYQYEGLYYDLSEAIFVRKLTEAGKDALARVYRSGHDHCSKLDEKLFGFETAGKDVIVSKDKFLVAVYKYVVYRDMVEAVRRMDAPEDLKQEKIQELAESDKALRSLSTTYLKRNQLVEEMGVDEMLRKWGKHATMSVVESFVEDQLFWMTVALAGHPWRGHEDDSRTAVERIAALFKVKPERASGILEMIRKCVANPALLKDEDFMSAAPDTSGLDSRRAIHLVADSVIARLIRKMEDKALARHFGTYRESIQNDGQW